MDTVADRKHLIERGGVWYYRRRVPKGRQFAVGREFIQQSLNTKSITEAQKARNVLDVKYDMEFVDVTEPDKLTPISLMDLQSRLATYMADQLRRFEKRYVNDGPDDLSQLEEMVADKEAEHQTLLDPADVRRHQWVFRTANEVLGDRDVDGLSAAEIDEHVRRALVNVVRQEIAVLKDDFRASPANSSSTSSVTFGQIAEQYLFQEREKADANNRRPQWFEKLTQHVGFLSEVIGDSELLARIDYDACIRIQRILANLPAHREKRYASLSLEAAIKKRAADKAPLLSPTTQSEYLRTLKCVLQLATDKGLMANNPAANIGPVQIDQRSPDEKRAPFSNEQIATFFSSPFYQKWGSNRAILYNKEDRDWRFWLPLLMAFTGMRPGEACQLSASDIRQSALGTWYADISATDDDDGEITKKRLKTAPSKRVIPIHPTLIELGFIEFSQARVKSGKNPMLFGTLKEGPRGYYSDYPNRRFREVFLPEAVKLRPNQSFYSFRHSFRDALRRMAAPSDVVAALGGWSEGSKVSNNYGNPRDPDYLHQFVCKIGYPGLSLNFRYLNSK